MLDHADYCMAPTRQTELDHTGTDQECVCPEGSTVEYEVGIDDLSEVCMIYIDFTTCLRLSFTGARSDGSHNRNTLHQKRPEDT